MLIEGTTNDEIFDTLFNSAHGYKKVFWLFLDILDLVKPIPLIL